MALEGPGERGTEEADLGRGLCAGLGFHRSAGGEGNRDAAAALRLLPRPTQHFNWSGASASSKQDRGAERLFPGLQSKLPQPGASAAEIAPAALKLAVERRGTHCLPERDDQGLPAPPRKVRGHVLASLPPTFGQRVSASSLRSGRVQPGLASLSQQMRRSSRGCATREGARSQPALAMYFWVAKEVPGVPGGRAVPRAKPSTSAPACSGVRNFARGSGRAAWREASAGRGGDAARAPGGPDRGW